jgi:hypothetical protein
LTTSIHAINARDSGLVSWLYDIADQDPARFRSFILDELDKLSELLALRALSYEALKSALIPSREGRQVVFLYDWYEHKTNYAVAFTELWLPLIRKKAKFSTKSGDLLNLPEFVEEFESVVVKARDEIFRWNTLYAVYFSNLSPSDVEVLHSGLCIDPRYRGYLDVTFGSEARDFMAETLTPGTIFFEGNVVLSHGGDEPIVGEEDPLGFPYGDYGFRLTSVIDSYFYPFLDYKIESYASRDSAEDAILSLAIATGEHVDPRFVPVFVHTDKVEKYLLRDENKLALMTSIGLQEVDADELGEIVADHLRSNYIYDMKLAADGTPTFAISAEFEAVDGRLVKRLVALKLDAAAGHVALVSLY